MARQEHLRSKFLRHRRALLALVSPCQCFFLWLIEGVEWAEEASNHSSWLFQGKSSNGLHFTNFVRFLLISFLCVFTSAICNRLSDIFSIRSGYISESVVKNRSPDSSRFPLRILNKDYCHPLVWRVISPHTVFVVCLSAAFWPRHRWITATQASSPGVCWWCF